MSVEAGSLIFWIFVSNGIARPYFKGTEGMCDTHKAITEYGGKLFYEADEAIW